MLRAVISVVAGAVLLANLAGGCFLLAHGVQARAPSRLETKIMNATKHWLVGAKNATNPLTASAENISEGRQNFSHYCYACHGLDGQGTGVPFADSMSPPVPSLASPNVQSYRDGQLHWVVKNGLWPSGMPAAKGILTDDEIWSIVLYIRHLPPAGSLGEPPAYNGDACAPAQQ